MAGLVLVLATVATGLIAGLFYAYSCSVMLALRRVDDRTFIEVMRRINAAIQNGWFALGFVGGPLLTAIALVLNLDGGPVMPLIVAGLVLHVLTLVITFAVNIPLNNRLDAAGDPAQLADPALVRRSFEAPWVRWNLARTLASIAAFGCLCWALTF
ncbi:DUF1772 domain-containing protein [Sphaerimonospora cavernae]|uniref:DUF1772 domain-containing protein n=1 Tax=Sphaerimonospora cavernae TaxID=1740611 RepID=A0ABV6U906_9ACTN